MAKKADLLTEAKTLGLKVTEKNTIAEIEAALKSAPAADVKADTDSSVAEKKSAKADRSSDAAAEPAKQTAKSGKRSAKAAKEAEDLAAKEARKAEGDTSPQSEEAEAANKKGPVPVARPKLERRGKKYRAAAQKIEADKAYKLAEAIKLAAETSPAKFDASVELHIRLGVDPRQADQNVRSTVALPHGSGKTTRVAALVNDADVEAATKAGADVAGEAKVFALLDKEQLDFDVLVATPEMMPKLGKYARTLGPRGLMPNPKSGTVATNFAGAIKEAKGGRVEYRVDKQAVVHLSVGKVSFEADKLLSNAKAFFTSLDSVKPTSLKGSYILSATASTTMGPGIKIDTASLKA